MQAQGTSHQPIRKDLVEKRELRKKLQDLKRNIGATEETIAKIFNTHQNQTRSPWNKSDHIDHKDQRAHKNRKNQDCQRVEDNAIDTRKCPRQPTNLQSTMRAGDSVESPNHCRDLGGENIQGGQTVGKQRQTNSTTDNCNDVFNLELIVPMIHSFGITSTPNKNTTENNNRNGTKFRKRQMTHTKTGDNGRQQQPRTYGEYKRQKLNETTLDTLPVKTLADIAS